MENTIFLASLWGPALLAVGIGFYLSKEHYRRIYRDIQREPFALLMFGMAGIAVGIVHIGAHNVWGNLPEAVISLLGWGILVKSVVFLLMPNVTDRMGDKVAKTGLFNFAGLFMLLLGAYLSWLAYFM